MSRFTTFSLTILLAFAPAALAVDGTVLINQSTITNGLPGCPTGGHFPIIICQAGSYRLSGNLTVPDANATAIQIAADNVTIDLNGFSIFGPVVCAGLPVTSCSPSNGSGVGITGTNSFITISNGVVRGFGTNGIFFPGGTLPGIGLVGAGIRIEGVTVSNNMATGIVLGSTDAIVALCHANNNGGTGISGGGTLSNNSALFNGRDGFSWDGSATGNSSLANGGSGFNGVGVFTLNNASGNNSFGISVFNPSVITSNFVFGNGGTISSVSGSVISNNVAQ